MHEQENEVFNLKKYDGYKKMKISKKRTRTPCAL